MRIDPSIIRPSGRLLQIVVYMVLALSLAACIKDRNSNGNSAGEAVISLTVSAASRSINADTELWEDRVDELRMLVFDPGDGSIVLNQKLYFPNGFAQQSRSVRIVPGTYDFYFIANETVFPGNFVNALETISNVSDFGTDSRFRTLAYDPGFVPDGTSSEGRFLMSAIYEGITVASGGTENNPVLLPLPTATVELVRALAKVEVVFRKNIPGSEITNTVTSVRLSNVASVYSVPPVDSFYSGFTTLSEEGDISNLNYDNDSIGSVTFYIPEFLVQDGGTDFTELQINNNTFPIETDDNLTGLTQQRRQISGLSTNSVIRNYHYIVNAYINAEGGIRIRVFVQPWDVEKYLFLFHGDLSVIIPPIEPTDSSIIVPTECGTIEILSVNEHLTQGLQGAYNDIVTYYDPATQGPLITRGDPPYYCEKKYGEGWRLINSCELMSFLAYCDAAYNVWTSNTWLADGYDMPYYPLALRQEAQSLLQNLTGFDLSSTVLYPSHNNQDQLADEKVGLIDEYFTPGDIIVREQDFPGGWPYHGRPNSLEWYYNEATIQVKAYWYGDEYISPSIRSNWDTILYYEFERYDFSAYSRCVRVID